MKKLSIVIAVSALIFGFVGCGSTPKQGPVMPVQKAPENEIDKVVVVDWTDRALGEIQAPTWLKNMRRGNSDTFKQQWGTDSTRVVKVSQATGNTEAEAQALSRAGFAYTQAAE